MRSYNETFKLNTVITRCSNIIDLSVSREVDSFNDYKCQNDMDLPVYGDGRNIRDWIFVDDHNRGVWQSYLKGKSGEVYNFGGDAEKGIDVVKTLLSILDKPSPLIKFVEDRKGHDWRYAIMNFDKAKKELDWTPQLTFEKGLKSNWYKEIKVGVS